MGNRLLYLPKKKVAEKFITEWTVAGTEAARTIALPLVSNRNEGALTYDCMVDWGDGSAISAITAYDDADRVHIYASDGTYQVKITGTCEGWSFNNGGDKLKIVKVINWGSDGFLYLRAGFYGCTNLTSIPTTSIPAKGTGILSDGFYYVFAVCQKLDQEIPADIFKLHPNVSASAFYATFYHCSKLKGSIPEHLFDYHAGASTSGFAQTFAYCLLLTGIPAELFKYNTAVSTSGFYGTFQGCTGITGIPSGLFSTNVSVSSSGFNSTFYGCSGITSAIPSGLFNTCAAVTTYAFYQTFYNCSKIPSFPASLFDGNTEVSSQGFNSTFYGCALLDQAIPDYLFVNNTKVSDNGFYATFQGCAKLSGNIPVHLFTTCTLVTANGFGYCFYGCKKLSGAIPADLFTYNTSVSQSGFRMTFYQNWLITEIPAGLFDHNPLIGTAGFYGTFAQCTGITAAVPADLFKLNTSAGYQGFTGTFSGCTLLTTIPEGLFRYNTAVSTQGFLQTFYNCNKLQLQRYLFYASGEEGTRFLNRLTDFSSTFGISTFTGTQGTAPELWLCNYGSAAITVTGTFNGHTTLSVTNLADIAGILTINVSPATDWAQGDTLTGQSSGKTCTCAQKRTATTYWVSVYDVSGWTSGEEIGVTGNPAKLADQNTGAPSINNLWRF